jgi:hypothetical protein
MGDFESIIKQFTRFFVPGLAFLVFAMVLPAVLLGTNLCFGENRLIGVVDTLLLSVLIGYVLDSIKGYRWTLMYAAYKRKKVSLVDQLANLSGQEANDNPDHHIAVLWRHDETTYNRILVERAEWVMILETSFSLLSGAFVLLAATMYALLTKRPVCFLFFPLPFILIFASYLAAKNGIDRMVAHDLKMVEAMRLVVKQREKSGSFGDTA